MSTKELIEKIKSKDDNVRGDAWQNAGDAGPDAVKPLADLMAEGEMEVSRSAKRALWKIVRHVGRPGAGTEVKAVLPEFESLLKGDRPVAVVREVLWMISELTPGGPVVEKIAARLQHAELREDARMVLERIPGKQALAALEQGFKSAPEDFKTAIAHSLRVRGVEVAGYPCQKLVPTKKTNVRPVGRA